MFSRLVRAQPSVVAAPALGSGRSLLQLLQPSGVPRSAATAATALPTGGLMRTLSRLHQRAPLVSTSRRGLHSLARGGSVGQLRRTPTQATLPDVLRSQQFQQHLRALTAQHAFPRSQSSPQQQGAGATPGGLGQRRAFSFMPSFQNIPPWLINLVLRQLPKLLPLLIPLLTSGLGLLLRSLPFIAAGFLMLYATYIVQTSRGIVHWIILYSLVGSLVLYLVLSGLHHLAWAWALEPRVLDHLAETVDAPAGEPQMVLALAEPTPLTSNLTLSPHDYEIGFSLRGNPEIPGAPMLWCTYTWEAGLTPQNRLRPHEQLAGRFEAVYSLSLRGLGSRGPLDLLLGLWGLRSLNFQVYNQRDISNESRVRETVPLPLPTRQPQEPEL